MTANESKSSAKLERKTLREHECQCSTLKADAAEGVLRNCKILGFSSKNKRRYLREAVQSALSMYQNVAVNLDHPDPDRPESQRQLRDRFGLIENVNLQDDGLYGDLIYNPKHPLAESIAWFASHRSSLLGLSHNAVGEGRTDRQGVFEVEKIHKVWSVDLVADPATTKSLFEDHNMPGMYDDATDADLFADAPPDDEGEKKKLTEEDPPVEEMPPVDDAAPVEAADGSDHLQSAKSLIQAILDDGTLSATEMKDKINHVLELFQDETDLADENAATGAGLTDEADLEELEEDDSQMSMADDVKGDKDGKKKKPCDEAVRTDEAWDDPALELEFRRGKDRARKLCEELKLPRKAQSERFIENLATYGEAMQRDLIEDRKQLIRESRTQGEPLPKVAGKGKPKSAAPGTPLRESVERKKDVPVDDFLVMSGLCN